MFWSCVNLLKMAFSYVCLLFTDQVLCLAKRGVSRREYVPLLGTGLAGHARVLY